jgi:hypothetical protein
VTKLAKLHTDGVLSDEEFKALKNNLIGNAGSGSIPFFRQYWFFALIALFGGVTLWPILLVLLPIMWTGPLYYKLFGSPPKEFGPKGKVRLTVAIGLYAVVGLIFWTWNW